MRFQKLYNKGLQENELKIFKRSFVHYRVLKKTSTIAQLFRVWQFGLSDSNHRFRYILNGGVSHLHFGEFVLNRSITSVQVMVFLVSCKVTLVMI